MFISRNITHNVINLMVFFLFVLSLTVMPLAFTADVGVRVGDWAKYQVSVAANLNETESEPWMENLIRQMNEILWINVTAKERIQGLDTIEISEMTFFKNGTSVTNTYFGSLRRPSELRYWVISSGLEVGDDISTEEEVSNFTVQHIRWRKYVNATRRSIHGALEAYPDAGPPQMAEGYWDQETGILCSCLFTYQESENSDSVFVEVKITGTNIWKPDSPDDKVSLWLGIIVAVIIVIIFFSVIRKKKGKKRR